MLTATTAALASAQEEGGGGGGMEQVNPIRKNAVIAHGTIMGFAFAFLFPMGAIIIRTSTIRGLIWIHAGIQAFAWLLALTGLALGVYIAIYPDSQVRKPYSPAVTLSGARKLTFLLLSVQSQQRPSHYRHNCHRQPRVPAYYRLHPPPHLQKGQETNILGSATRWVGTNLRHSRYHQCRLGS